MALTEKERVYRRRESQQRYYARNKEKRARAILKSKCKQFLKEFATASELVDIKKIIDKKLNKLVDNNSDK